MMTFFRSIVRQAALCIALLTLHLAVSSGEEPSAVLPPSESPSPDSRYRIGELLFSDDFTHGLDRWAPELEQGGDVQTRDGKLVIDTPAGCTLWFKQLIEGPVLIRYDAAVISANGQNDRVSDLNCFWMARDSRAPDDILSFHRNGKFSEYNPLRTYYAGLGGNENTTTRFRRYIGDAEQRPLLPEHDLRDRKHLLAPNISQTLRLIACGPLIQFYRDSERLFELQDPDPYKSGWFAFRTVKSHLEIKNFRVYRLHPAPAPPTAERQRN